MTRCFVASFLPEDVGVELEKFAMRPLTGVRWLAPSKYHVTFRFFGEIEDTEIERQQHIVAAAATEHFPVDCVIRTVTGFPHHTAARVVVALVESEGALERVAARFSAQTFTAHVTLGRDRGGVALPEYASVDLAVRLPNVGLYRSETLPAGARYTMLDPKLDPGR